MRAGLLPDARKRLGAYYTPRGIVEDALADLPAPAPSARVIDLACGDGEWLAGARARWPGVRLVGVDVDEAAVERAAARLPGACLQVGDGRSLPLEQADLLVGNPPWGAGRVGGVRRGRESASEFVRRAIELLSPGGRLCLLLPAAWLEVASHRPAREALLARCALERVEPLGDPFPGVFAPCALLVARREDDAEARARQRVWTPAGFAAQATLTVEGTLNPRLSARDRSILAQLDARAERLGGRVTFILGVVTGGNRRALATDGDGEPILAGPDVRAFAIAPPSRRLVLPLQRVQQAAPRRAYAREKVVYRFIARHPVAAVDGEGRLTLNSANALAPDDPALDPHYVTAALNSTALKFVHLRRHGQPRVLRSHLEALPLPSAGAGERRAIARLAVEKGAAAQAELDARLLALYGISSDDRAYVEAACRAS